MAKFVQKLQVVEAVQFDGTDVATDAIVAACPTLAIRDTAMRNGEQGFVEVQIIRVLGVELHIGDWLVADRRGSFDVMSDADFQIAYEAQATVS